MAISDAFRTPAIGKRLGKIKMQSYVQFDSSFASSAARSESAIKTIALTDVILPAV